MALTKNHRNADIGKRPAAAPRAAAAYHHGDLRQALLDAAQSLLEERGLEGFTLRECARRAGVSHAAPAHHFGDATGLLTVFATLGFERMSAMMQSYRDAAGPSAVAQLRAVGLAYVDFGVRHRAQFQLMFRHDRLAARDAALEAAGGRAAGHLSQVLAAALAERGLAVTPADFDHRLLLAWSAVHGFASLALEGQFMPWQGRRSAAGFAAHAGDRVLALLEVALLAQAPAPAGLARPARHPASRAAGSRA